jgi:epoxyqueuosine reductase QueG
LAGSGNGRCRGKRDRSRSADDLIAMSQEEFSAAFRKSPMKRAKLARPKRNARVVLACDDEV